MSDEPKIDLSKDLKGLLCPVPVVKVSQAIKELPAGGVLEAFATDPGVQADIPAWCRTTGNELLKMERRDGVFRFIIRRR